MTPSELPESQAHLDEPDLSNLFTRPVQADGRTIRRPLPFYIALNKVGRVITKRLILKHGGQVAAQPGGPESHVIALVDPLAKATVDGRTAYSVDFIQQCISKKRLLDIEAFRLSPVGRRRVSPSKSWTPAKNNSGTAARNNAIRGGTLPEKAGRNGKSPKNGPAYGGEKFAEPTSKPCDDEPDDEQTDDMPVLADHIGEPVRDKNPAQEPRVVKARDAAASIPLAQNGDSARADDSDFVPELQEERNQSDETMQGLATPDRTVNHANGNELDDVSWTKEEDNTITNLCFEAKLKFRERGQDPAKTFTLACWADLEKDQLLPEGRTIEACYERARLLWQNGTPQNTPSPAKRKSSERPRKKMRSVPSPSNRADEEEDEKDNEEPAHAHDTNSLPHPDSSEGQARLAQAKEFKPAGKIEKRKRIIELVKRISHQGHVSKRRAFRALRSERGDWKRALRAVTRRHRRENT